MATNKDKNANEDLDSIGEPVSVGSLDSTINENKIYEEKTKGSKSKHRHNVFLCALYFITVSGVIILSVRLYHYVASDCYQWLTPEQIQSLDKLLFTGTMGTVLGRFGNKLIE